MCRFAPLLSSTFLVRVNISEKDGHTGPLFASSPSLPPPRYRDMQSSESEFSLPSASSPACRCRHFHKSKFPSPLPDWRRWLKCSVRCTRTHLRTFRLRRTPHQLAVASSRDASKRLTCGWPAREGWGLVGWGCVVLERYVGNACIGWGVDLSRGRG